MDQVTDIWLRSIRSRFGKGVGDPGDGLVSIVVPAYNDASTLSDTLESLRAQRHERWEAIVVDDGSTDDTAKLIASYAQKDARFQLVHQAHGGPSAARNSGIAQAEGEFLMFLDADDVFCPHALQKLTRALRRNPRWDAVHCGWWNTPNVSEVPRGSSFCRGTGDLFELVCKYNQTPVCTVMVRRRILEAVGGWDESLTSSEDWDFWLQIARTGACFGRVSEVLCMIRERPGSNIRDARRLFDTARVVLERAHGPDPRVRKPHPKHRDGAPSSQKPIAIASAAWACLGLALGHRDVEAAAYILSRVAREYPDLLKPEQIGEGMGTMIWRGALVKPGEWDQLWPKISKTLCEFLLKQEHELARPGFACSVVAHLAGQGLLQRTLKSTTWRLGRAITRLKFW